jgi:hypothetical protein
VASRGTIWWKSAAALCRPATISTALAASACQPPTRWTKALSLGNNCGTWTTLKIESPRTQTLATPNANAVSHSA